ncbi:SE-cephalotoxin [Anabarilius grahami]|uniref:SE-cephalotoxin n=1 Tax=Anabarilius grahami TaxID=495550 RepID=A0A3N0XZR0_ANAGA|nr:SE-cephalotoxin [Anabarilius grahami]
MLEFMKEQFAEVNRKLDSLSFQISTLQTEMKWTNYASSYGKDENVIKNSWAKLTEFIKTAPAASTEEQKTRLAERFTTFFENTGTENSVANFYRYITENNPVSLNKNLLQLIIEKSNGDFNVLVQYSSYFTTLMVSGLKLNVFYYKLKGYDAEVKAKEAVTQLSNTLSAIQDALIECANGFETWAQKDAVKLSSEQFSSSKDLATDIKKHLESKFHWFKWIVIAHSKDAENEFIFGQSINFYAQEKTSVHIIHQERGSVVDQNTKDSIKSSLQKEMSFLSITMQCLTMKEELLSRFGAKATTHIQFLHAVTKPSDYAQTDVADIELICKAEHVIFRDFNIFLKGNIVKPPCSDVNCNHGECKPIKGTTQGFCKCHKMFHGPACEESIQNIIDYAALEGEIDGMIYKPVPDLTAIYFSVKDLKDYTKEIVESVRDDIQWTQIFVKYNLVIEKFRYINALHSQLKNSAINQRHYVSEVGAQFTGGHSFQFYLSGFHDMMMGTGFGVKQTILDMFRKSLVQDSQSQSGEPVECSKNYSDKIDYFVRYMFALEKEAVLAWSKYLLVTEKSENIDFVEKFFQKYISQQWKLFNKNGCGPLQAADLQNNYCEKPYHSTAGQQVKMKCGGPYKPFPEIAVCSGGKWSALPVCYTEQVNGRVECKSEGGATVCKASCSSGWGSATHPQPAEYKCSQSPCPSFIPHKCNDCTQSSVCKDNEVCTGTFGTCRDACLVKPCGVNTKCSSSNHDRSCTCVSPWKGDPYQGCRSQDLQWVQTGGVPSNAVRSNTQLAVCRAIGPDSGWHSGYVKDQYCTYEYDWGTKWASSYEVLVDPCGGRGWKWTEGAQWNMVPYDESKRFPGVKYYVCRDHEPKLDQSAVITVNGGCTMSYKQDYYVKCNIRFRHENHTCESFKYEFDTNNQIYWNCITFIIRETQDPSQIELHCTNDGGSLYSKITEDENQRQQEEERSLEHEQRFPQELDRGSESSRLGLSQATERGHEQHHKHTQVLHQQTEEYTAAIERDEVTDVEEKFKELLLKYQITEDKEIQHHQILDRIKKSQNELADQYSREHDLSAGSQFTFDQDKRYNKLSLTEKLKVLEASLQFNPHSSTEDAKDDEDQLLGLEKKYDFLFGLVEQLHSTNPTVAKQILLSLLDTISELSPQSREILGQMLLNRIWTPTEIMLFIFKSPAIKCDELDSVLDTAQTYHLDSKLVLSALTTENPLMFLQEKTAQRNSCCCCRK